MIFSAVGNTKCLVVSFSKLPRLVCVPIKGRNSVLTFFLLLLQIAIVEIEWN